MTIATHNPNLIISLSCSLISPPRHQRYLWPCPTQAEGGDHWDHPLQTCHHLQRHHPRRKSLQSRSIQSCTTHLWSSLVWLHFPLQQSTQKHWHKLCPGLACWDLVPRASYYTQFEALPWKPCCTQCQLLLILLPARNHWFVNANGGKSFGIGKWVVSYHFLDSRQQIESWPSHWLRMSCETQACCSWFQFVGECAYG